MYKAIYEEQVNTKTYPQNEEQDKEANEITDILKKQLGSNASEEKVIPKLQREDATISGQYAKISHIFCQNDKYEVYKEQKHVYLSWIACYDDNYKVYILEKDGAGQYPSELKRQAPKATKIDYNNTCRYIGYVNHDRHEYWKKQNPRYGILYQILYLYGYSTQEKISGNDKTSQ